MLRWDRDRERGWWVLCRSVFLTVLSLCLRVLTTDSLFFVFLVIVLYILLFIDFLWVEVEVFSGAVLVEFVQTQLGSVAMAAMSATVCGLSVANK